MSLVFKKLKKKGIIIDKDGDLFMNSNIFLKGQAHSINAKQRPNVKKAQGFVVDEKERFENVYTFRTETDESNEMDNDSEQSTDNEDLKLQSPEEIPDCLFEKTE
ncbi:hypothetical protein NL303_25145 [Klebsiella pneumoniae]|nr:hypothetical protein [Klebsiella pneumoniae]MCP6385045.1 hypothetical protein [Klebsiella pneumoniae]